MDFVSYSNEKQIVNTKYLVEYIADERDWEKVLSEIHPAPWELYCKKSFEDIGQAISFYICRVFDNQTFDCKLFEQIELNDEIVREKYIELDNTIKYSIGTLLNKDRESKLKMQEQKISELLEELTAYQSFAKVYKIEEQFKEFKKKGTSQ